MANLVLKRFHCITQDDDSGGDSPYFIIYVGDIVTGKVNVKRVKQGNWDNEVDGGENWTVNETVATGFSLNNAQTYVLVACIEEDDNVDISSAEIDAMETAMRSQLAGFSGIATMTFPVRTAILTLFRQRINSALGGGNDDFIGKIDRLAPVTASPGELADLVKFRGSGDYNVRFGVE